MPSHERFAKTLSDCRIPSDADRRAIDNLGHDSPASTTESNVESPSSLTVIAANKRPLPAAGPSLSRSNPPSGNLDSAYQAFRKVRHNKLLQRLINFDQTLDDINGKLGFNSW